MKAIKAIFSGTLLLLLPLCSSGQGNIIIRGWNILSDSFEDDIATINAASSYNINHLQLSHDLVMDLQEIRDPEKQKLVNELISLAHKSGINEVVAWDHTLYSLKYYPDRFKTGPGNTIDLDNPDFWEWFKNDYRAMLSLIPEIDGIVLTFIETGAEKLASVVDAVADIICQEMGKKLYIRTFAYTDAEYKNTIGCIEHIKNQDVILMMKETPHDFFLTHPNDKYAGTIDRPTIMEFDCGNEFNGLKPAFRLAYDIVTSSLYTLGTNVANHSKMDFDPYKSSYGRHVSGKWLDPPVVLVGHGINKEFNYWTDIIEHLAPARFKTTDGPLKEEAPVVVEKGWVTPEEKMYEEYLRYIVTEKKYSVKTAEKALKLVMRSKPYLKENDYNQIYNLFYRTLLTARVYEAAATAYFGYRVYARGEEYQTKWLKKSMNEALDKMLIIAHEIDNYKELVPRGQWNWRGDAATLREYYEKITKTGWKEHGNVVFK